MPLYDYQCETCGKVTTQQRKIAEMHQPESEPCEGCGETTVKKKILTGVIFNADKVKPDARYVERVREWKRTIPRNTLPDY